MQYENYVDMDLPKDVWLSVIDMTRECASGLFLESMSESHPLFNWQLTILEEEYKNYMVFTVPQVIKDVGRFSTGVVLARDPEKECAAGFVLYSRDFRNDDVVGIIGIAVRKGYRLQGVMTEMIKKLRQSTRDIGLSCSLGLVRAYHGLGFEVQGEQGAQVKMGWGGAGGEMARFQEGSFNNSDSVQAELSALRVRFGTSYGQVFSDRIGEIEAETLEVKTYIQKWQLDRSLLP